MKDQSPSTNLQHRTKILLTHLFGTAFEHDILLALVQPSLPHGPEVKHSVFPLQQLIQDVWLEKKKQRHRENPVELQWQSRKDAGDCRVVRLLLT